MPTKSSLGVIWDAENAKVPNEEGENTQLNALDKIQLALKANLEDINIDTIVACADMDNESSISREQRIHIYWSGGDLMDVPIPGENAADFEVMLQMAKFARAHPPPAYLVLITGDGDMCQALAALTKRGYTTLLAYPAYATNKKLLSCADYTVPWKSLYSGSLNGLKRTNLQLSHGIQLKRCCYNPTFEKRFESYVFWDAMSCPMPHDLEHSQVLKYIDEEVQRQVPSSCYSNHPVSIRVYGDRDTLPPLEEQTRRVNYRITSGDKVNSVANSLLVDLLEVAMRVEAPRNIVIITAVRGFNRVAAFLKSLRFRVFFSTTENAKLLQRSAELLFTWPPTTVRNVRRRRI